MNTKPEVHIENWVLHNGQMLTGNVQDHPRFAPGTFVYTSRVIEVSKDRAETLNTIYVLGKPASTTAETVEAREA